MEQIQAIMQAAHEANPVILQASRGARKYAGENFLRHLILAAVETYPISPLPCTRIMATANSCYSAIRHGFTSVMMDGSLEMPRQLATEVQRRGYQVVEVAHAVGVSVEGELGCLGSLETGMGDQEDGHGAEGLLPAVG